MMMTALMLVVLVAPMARSVTKFRVFSSQEICVLRNSWCFKMYSCMARILILCEVKVSPIGMKDYDF